MRYERRFAPPLPLRAFLWRLSGHFGVAAAFVLVSVLAGMVGYHHYERLHQFHWEGQDEDA